MKKILYTLVVIVYGCIISCTPDKYEIKEMELIGMDEVKEVRLRTSHYLLLADGKAQMEFNPLLITKDDFEINDSRVDHSKIAYYTTSGEKLSKIYRTSDKSLIGKKIGVYAEIKEYGLVSDTVSFTIADPAILETYTEITVPVVFHLIQSNDDVTKYGGDIPKEKIYQIMDKINNTFSGKVSHNATGVDTKITFQPALYNPYGVKLPEPGINRIYMDKVNDEKKDHYKTLIQDQKALWPYDKYLNIWLISDRNDEYRSFCYTISSACVPRYVNPGTASGGILPGLSLSVLPANWQPAPREVGILYKLQSTYLMARNFGVQEENELVNCVGSYYGLLRTWGDNVSQKLEDYCTDTQKYHGYFDFSSGAVKFINRELYKSVGDCFFLSENIMDDPVGVHRSVSLQQSLRVRWVLENCPERSAWKSDFAFMGK